MNTKLALALMAAVGSAALVAAQTPNPSRQRRAQGYFRTPPIAADTAGRLP